MARPRRRADDACMPANDPPRFDPLIPASPMPDRRARNRHHPWLPPEEAGRGIGATIGILVAVLLAVTGLVIVGIAIFFVVALNNMGSNK